jgi:hypothetical protein
MARYDALPISPIEQVRFDLFNQLSLLNFLRKLNERFIALSDVNIEANQKCQKGVHIIDLAHFLENRREDALREHRHFHM